MKENIQSNFYPNALEGIAVGVKYGADAVAPTLGIGSNVIIEKSLYPSHIITNDANSIIMALQVEDPLAKRGLAFLKEGATATTQQSGDGRTTMVLLLNQILEKGIEELKAGNVSPLQLKHQLDECLPIIESSLDSQTRQITVADIPAVAAIAGENESLAKTLGEIYKTIGKDGIVHLEGSGTYETSFSTVEGVRFSGTGYLSPYMAHDEDAQKVGRKETKAIYHNPSILVTKRKINHLNEINPLLGALQAENKKDLVIFADDMDSGVAQVLIEAHKSKVINLLIIKAPVFWKNYVFEDFAKITGSTIVEDASGITWKNLQLDHLGTCDTIIVDKDECTVIGIKDITDHLKDIQTDESLPKDDKAVRLTYLSTKTAILKLGAKSETELSYLRLKAEDAIHSSRLALQGGIVAGGGVALREVAYKLPDTIGGSILKKALVAPEEQIHVNAGLKTQNYELHQVVGLDARSGKAVDMFDAGIVDAALVVKNAVRNALGIASTLLTTSSVITLPPEPPKPLQGSPYPF